MACGIVRMAVGLVAAHLNSLPRPHSRPRADAAPGLHGLRGAGSYLGLDTDGRVLRVDSFAKFLAPGLRLGWVTAHPQIVDKLTMTIQVGGSVCRVPSLAGCSQCAMERWLRTPACPHTCPALARLPQSHTVGPCSLSQVVTAEALVAWGDEGLDAHLRIVQREYAQRCACICAAAERHLAGLATWTRPSAGMFLWLRLHGVQGEATVPGGRASAAQRRPVTRRCCRAGRLTHPCPARGHPQTPVKSGRP